MESGLGMLGLCCLPAPVKPPNLGVDRGFDPTKTLLKPFKNLSNTLLKLMKNL